MPNGIFPVPQFTPTRRQALRASDSSLAPGPGGGEAGWTSSSARGIDPETSVELRLRAAQLSSHSGRARLANGLVERLGDARGPNLGAFSMRTRRQDATIRGAADELQALVQRLRDERPVEVRGAAMAARLLYGKDSPLHNDSGPELRPPCGPPCRARHVGAGDARPGHGGLRRCRRSGSAWRLLLSAAMLGERKPGGVVDLLGPTGMGPRWGMASEELNATLLVWPPGHEVVDERRACSTFCSSCSRAAPRPRSTIGSMRCPR